MPARLARLLPAAILLALPAATRAQKPAPVVVRTQVSDTGNAPMADVGVAIIWGRDSVVLAGVTNSAGRYAFTFRIDSGLYRITARRVGYLPTTRLVRAAPGDTVNIALTLARIPPTLDTVHVEARARSDDYVIDSTMIARLHRPVTNIYDVIRDLRPNMLYNDIHLCGPTANIWVNGVHEQFGPKTDGPIAPIGRVQVDMAGHVTHQPSHVAPRHLDPESVLANIRPQDVAEVRYLDCRDTSMPGFGVRNALFITLKPGIVYDWKRGSVPADSVPGRR